MAFLFSYKEYEEGREGLSPVSTYTPCEYTDIIQ